MKRVKKSIIIGFMSMCFLFQSGRAQAIPIPTIGAELGGIIAQLTQYINELKKVKDQIMEGVNQAKSIGSKLSLDALKSVLKGQAQSALNGAIAAVEVSQDFKNIGFSEETLKDPEKISSTFSDIQKGLHEGDYDIDNLKKCWAARDSMLKQVTKLNLANSFSMQSYVSSGDGMKDAQDANSDSDDQMQMIQGQTAAMQAMYKQMSSTTVMNAGGLANEVLSKMCD